MFKNVKAVATDVDGTLTVSRRSYLLDPGAIKAIRDLETSGIAVMLVSGNSVPMTVSLARYLGATGPVIAENGCIAWYKGKEHATCTKSAKGAFDFVYPKMKGIVMPAWQNKYKKFDFAFIPLDTGADKITQEIKNLLKEGYPFIKVLYSGFAIHLLPDEAGKGVGLKKACELLGIDKNEVVAIGDGENDLDMLKASGVSVAVANADAALKKGADLVLKRPSGRGFGELARLLLKG